MQFPFCPDKRLFKLCMYGLYGITNKYNTLYKKTMVMSVVFFVVFVVVVVVVF